MPGTVLTAGTRCLLLTLPLAIAALLIPPRLWAAGGTVQVSVEVPAGKTKTIRLRNLPRGTDVAVRIDADGKLAVALVSGAQLRLRRPQALFRAALDRSMTFKVVTPESSNYYLVLDNRRGEAIVNARATIQVRKESSSSSEPSDKPGGKLEETRASL